MYNDDTVIIILENRLMLSTEKWKEQSANRFKQLCFNHPNELLSATFVAAGPSWSTSDLISKHQQNVTFTYASCGNFRQEIWVCFDGFASHSKWETYFPHLSACNFLLMYIYIYNSILHDKNPRVSTMKNMTPICFRATLCAALRWSGVLGTWFANQNDDLTW